MSSTLQRDFGSIFVSGLDFTGDKSIFNNGNGFDASTNSVITGNTYITQCIMGDGLVHRSNGVHTLFVNATNFTGNIQILATLGVDPANSTYLPVNLVSTIDGFTTNELSFDNNTGNGNAKIYFTVTGQYSWLKANISVVQHGILNLLKLAF
jgi:hypothetical protein